MPTRGSVTAPTAMLFCPPQPPVRLPDSRAFVLGRGEGCDLRLGGPDASRRHAEIAPVAGGGFALHDLDSTNGTYVNGERVGERRLQPGDRIQIGSHTLTFCHLDSAMEGAPTAQDNEQTLWRLTPHAGEAIQGDLAEIPAFAVLQMLELGSKTGLLEVDAQSGVGRLWLSEGAPAHAATKSATGFEAAVAIVNTQLGRFSFQAGTAPPERSIHSTLTDLLLEAWRVLDESSD